MDSVISFIKRMVDPDVGSGTTDVYGIMFGCQFIIFLIILFSWSAFAEAEVRGVSIFRYAQPLSFNVGIATPNRLFTVDEISFSPHVIN